MLFNKYLLYVGIIISIVPGTNIRSYYCLAKKDFRNAILLR